MSTTRTVSLEIQLEDYDLTLEISRPSWLFARTERVLGQLGMIVYRSVMVRDSDPMYAPVAELLSKCKAEVIRHSEVDDPKMMLGRAEWKFMLLSKKDLGARGECIGQDVLERLRCEVEGLISELVGAA